MATSGHFSAKCFSYSKFLYFFLNLGLSKQNINVFFEKLYDYSQDNCVGGILSNKVSALLGSVVLFDPFSSFSTYDWAILNINWPCKLFLTATTLI